MKELIQQILNKGTVEVIEKESLEKKLLSGEKLIIKHGADPTAPDLHLGHAVGLRKLREFQDLGHTIVLIIGDFTAKIGDPSGRLVTRPILTDEEIQQNAKTYFEQAGKILDIEKAEVHYNGEWYVEDGWKEVLLLTSKFTLQRILERDDFDKRIKSGAEILVNEILYPIMQAYDSVKIEADIEVGGTDQTFNMLTGRVLQRRMGIKEQDIITMPLLIGTDGEKKMSKSQLNYIGLTDSPEEMFGKTMSIPDKIIMNWIELAGEFSDEQIENFKKRLEAGENPMDIKMELAGRIVELYHNKDEVIKTKENFIKLFRKKELPENTEEIKGEKGEKLGDILLNNKIVDSKSDFSRLIEGGAIEVKGQKIDDIYYVVEDEIIVKVGKKKFVKIVF